LKSSRCRLLLFGFQRCETTIQTYLSYRPARKKHGIILQMQRRLLGQVFNSMTWVEDTRLRSPMVFYLILKTAVWASEAGVLI
jgi:hypothetical protein